MSTIKNNQYGHLGAENSRLRHSNRILKLLIFLLLILFTIIVSSVVYEFTDREKSQKINEQIKIQEIEDKYRALKSRGVVNERLLRNCEKENRRLRNKNRYTKKSTNPYTYNKPVTNRPTPKKNTYIKKNTYTPYTNNYVQEKSSNSTTYRKPNSNTKKNTSSEKYQRFSDDIQLISDSKITRQVNNKLKSNASIYGRYYPKEYSVLNYHPNQIANIECGLENNRYRAVDDCSMELSENYDKVYLNEMNSKSIANFNRNTHMIECKYSKEHGIMHDCKIKIFSR